MSINDLPEHVRVRQAAVFLGVSRKTVYRKIWNKEIKTVRFGSLHLIPRAELARCIGLQLPAA